VIIMTSNIGSVHLMEGVTSDGEIPEAARARVNGRPAGPLPAGVSEPGR
jgi:hypothetical protein